jgi:hypothetical protein
MEQSERSLAKIEENDLERLAALAKEDREEFFSRNPRWRQLYSARILCVALCQGAALHYIDQRNGVKDFDVWTFYLEHHEGRFPWRRIGTKDYGPSKFGKNPGDAQYTGRRIDLLARSIRCALPADPVQCIREYLAHPSAKTAWELSRKAVVLIEPRSLIGKTIWPWFAE